MKTKLFAVFLLIFIVKLILIFRVPTPWIYADEVVYSESARGILSGNFFYNVPYAQNYPLGYPFLICLFFLSDNMILVHKLILIFNSFISVMILPISYMILKELKVKDTTSLYISSVIVLLPSVFPYSFVIMSENLFIPLLLLLNLCLLRAIQHHQKNWYWVFLLSFILFLTRAEGIIILISVMITSAIYLIYNKKEWKKLCLSYFTLLVLFLTYSIIKLYFSSSVTGYATDKYIDNMLNWLTFKGFILFLKLFVNELSYLFVTSFGIGFLGLSFLAFQSAFSYLKKESSNNDDKKLFIMFNILCILFSIVLTVAHMYFAASDINHPEHSYYFVFGRYIDPFVPIVFLLGCFYFYETKSFYISKVILCVIVSLLLILILPVNNYKMPNMFGALIFNEHGFYFKIALAIFICGYLLNKFYYKSIRATKYVFVYLALTIVLSSLVTVSKQIESSGNLMDYIQASKWVAEYKKNNSIDTIYYEFNELDVPSFFSLLFWSGKSNVVEISDLKDIENNNVKNEKSLIVSSELLPKQVLFSKNGITVYNYNEPFESSSFLRERESLNKLDIAKEDEYLAFNMYGLENSSSRWTMGKSTIVFPYSKYDKDLLFKMKIGGERPIDDPAIGKVKLNGVDIGDFTKYSGEIEIEFNVSKSVMRQGYQSLEIDTNTWNPADYGSLDSRELGVQLMSVDWEPIDNLLFGEFYSNSVEKSGVYTKEMGIDGNLYQWTNGHAKLKIPIINSAIPKYLHLSLYNNGKLNREMKVMVNSIEIYKTLLGDNVFEDYIPLEGINNQNDKIDVEIVTPEWCPCDEGSTDTRKLGVAIQTINFLYDDLLTNYKQNLDKMEYEMTLIDASNEFVISQGAVASLSVRVNNTGNEIWPNTKLDPNTPVRIGQLWYSKDSGNQVSEHRTELPYSLSSGDKLEQKIKLIPKDSQGNPIPPGEYIVTVGLVQEGVAWFHDKGNNSDIQLKVTVRE